MTLTQSTRIGRFLSYVLRHAPHNAGVVLDSAGWVSVESLISRCSAVGYVFTRAELEDIVANCAKQRYEFNYNKTKIRACQGHTVAVDLNYAVETPPEILFHGTATQYLDQIAERGLQKMKRHHVHLSQDIETAKKVGARHGDVVVLTVNARQMHDNGHAFYRSTNGVWLTDSVPTTYIQKHET